MLGAGGRRGPSPAGAPGSRSSRPCSAAGRNAHVKAGGTEYKWQLPQRNTALHGQGTPRAGEPGHPHTTPNLLRLIQGASTCPFFLPALSQQPLDVQNLPVLFRSVCKSRIPPSFCSAALVRCSFKNQTYSIPLFSYFSVLSDCVSGRLETCTSFLEHRTKRLGRSLLFHTGKAKEWLAGDLCRG